MTILKMIAFSGFMVSAIALTMNGIVYLASHKIMSYHCGAIEKSWDELSNGAQIMCLCFMKSAAAGMLSVGIVTVMLLLFPYRSGELWSEIAVSLVALLESGILASRVAIVRKKTKGRPPLALSVLLFIVAIISVLCTFIEGM
ncbi:MAG: hypothetical protein LKJ25_06975 [Clostridia bacterium]|jgi:hypothetical protein|nr:hypothetical protein [Clostridia bacterium]